jgi:hypothetical protein
VHGKTFYFWVLRGGLINLAKRYLREFMVNRWVCDTPRPEQPVEVRVNKCAQLERPCTVLPVCLSEAVTLPCVPAPSSCCCSAAGCSRDGPAICSRVQARLLQSAVVLLRLRHGRRRDRPVGARKRPAAPA